LWREEEEGDLDMEVVEVLVEWLLYQTEAFP
jgi:hypothetical protein